MSATANSAMPRSVTLSAFLHMLVIGGVVFLAWWSQRVDREPPAIFELVGGDGQNYMAEQAPTLTAETTPRIDVTLPEPLPEYVPPKPVVVHTPPPPITRVPEPTKTLVMPKQEPKEPPVRIEQVKEPVSFDDFQKQHGTPKPRPVAKPKTIAPRTIDVSRLVADTNIITEGAGGTAMTAREESLTKRYVAQILQAIQRAMEQAGINDVRDAGVKFNVSATGVISDASITRSSGSREFDRAILSAFRTIRPLGAPPTNRAESFSTVIRFTEG
ncbi:MAG: hypothetical protein SynsKO_17200 [Synoicihabitans sp.]